MVSHDLTKFKVHYKRVLDWVHKSIAATEGNGSAAWFHLFKSWGPAYPETSGYLIESLLASGQERDRLAAVQLGKWLCSIQLPSGAFPGGVGTNGKPLIFDSGMILGGLNALCEIEPNGQWKQPMLKCRDWLFSVLAMQNQFLYRVDYEPTYHVLVLARILSTQDTQDLSDSQQEIILKKLDYYYSRINAQGFPTMSGFSADEVALTHTLAYSLEGFLNCGLACKRPEIIESVKVALREIIAIRTIKDYLPARIAEDWTTHEKCVCVPGNAQMSILCSRMYQIDRDPEFHVMAKKLFYDIADIPRKRLFDGASGGVPGSLPIRGSYYRWAFPNWAAKYYLDAYIMLKQTLISV